MTNVVLSFFVNAIIAVLLLNMLNLIVANIFDINFLEILVNWIKRKTGKNDEDL